jgi:uncharacterized membrane protein (DUF485 family)
MFNFNFFEQKSPQQRFLFILGVVMIMLYTAIGILVVFFPQKIRIDPEVFPSKYRIPFGILLFVYAIIRFSRLFSKEQK